jgi:membrane protein YdbS with pleckstrin-like domain
MQFVEVSAGPLARAFKMATIQLHTASPGTDATLSGVRAADAETLRDRMTSRGEARLAGL